MVNFVFGILILFVNLEFDNMYLSVSLSFNLILIHSPLYEMDLTNSSHVPRCGFSVA